MLGGAYQIGFVGLAVAQRQFARELHRVGADAVIGRDAAQSAQAPVERRPLADEAARSPSSSSSLSRPGLGPTTTIRMRLPMLAGAPEALTVANDDRSAAS